MPNPTSITTPITVHEVPILSTTPIFQSAVGTAGKVKVAHPFSLFAPSLRLVAAENKTPAAYRIFWHYASGKELIMLIAITPHH